MSGHGGSSPDFKERKQSEEGDAPPEGTPTPPGLQFPYPDSQMEKAKGRDV